MTETTEADRQLLGAGVDKLLASLATPRSIGGYAAESDAAWAGLAELGLLALPFSPEAGGLGLGWRDLAAAMGALGRNLSPEPYLSTVVLGGALIERAAGEAQRSELVGKIASGELKVAFAYAEPTSRYNLASVSVRATPHGDGFALTGAKSVVLGAGEADLLVVTARTSGCERDREGISLFLVARDAPGVTAAAHRFVDGRSAAEVTFAGAQAQLLGRQGDALPLVEAVIDEAAVAVCAESVAAMARLNETTLEFCKTRVVFEQPLSKFQAVQHRLVDMHVAFEHVSALVEAAIDDLETAPDRRALAVSAAKAAVAREGGFIAKAAVQLHGAAGVTEDLDIGRYFKRLMANNILFGSQDHHLRRYFDVRRADDVAAPDMVELTPEDLGFRDEVRTFLAEALTPQMREAGAKTLWAISEFEYGRQWQKALNARGWGAPGWPVEYGGPDWTPGQRLVWAMEMARERPPSVMNMGRDLCAPCIMAFGTEEQKAFYLPRILNGDDWWAQGYSEPGAGSDLASLQLSAVSDGDHYVLNGSKIWTTMAHRANRIFCLVRTSREAKKQAGITFLLVDMDTPGIEIRPIVNISGAHDFNQVYFTDVRVPKANRLGEEGQGWTVARHLLSYEHGGSVYDGLEMRRRLAWLEEVARAESDGRGGVLFDDPDFQLRFAEIAVECEASDAVTRRLVAQARAGGPPSHMAELLNIRRREVGQRLTELVVDALGPYGAPYQGQALQVGGGPGVGPEHAVMPTAFYLAQRAATLAGGAADVHRNNVARRILGL